LTNIALLKKKIKRVFFFSLFFTRHNFNFFLSILEILDEISKKKKNCKQKQNKNHETTNKLQQSQFSDCLVVVLGGCGVEGVGGIEVLLFENYVFMCCFFFSSSHSMTSM